MTTQRSEFAITLGLILLGLLGLYFTSLIDLAFSSDLETFSGPRAYPRIILVVFLAFISIVGINQLRVIFQDKRSRPDAPPVLDKATARPALLFAALVVFAIAFECVGYILTMIPLLTGVAVLCGAKKIFRALIVSLILTAVCLVIFRYGLSTVLPEGILGIDAVL